MNCTWCSRFLLEQFRSLLQISDLPGPIISIIPLHAVMSSGCSSAAVCFISDGLSSGNSRICNSVMLSFRRAKYTKLNVSIADLSCCLVPREIIPRIRSYKASSSSNSEPRNSSRNVRQIVVEHPAERTSNTTFTHINIPFARSIKYWHRVSGSERCLVDL